MNASTINLIVFQGEATYTIIGPKARHAYNTLTISQNVLHSFNREETSNTITFSQTVVSHTGYSNQITFSQTVATQFVRSRSVSQSLNFTDHATVYKENNINFNITEVPNITHQGVTFTYGSLSVSLRAPDLGDTEGYEQNRINRRSRGQDLIIYRDPIWPKRDILRWDFKAISKTKANEFQSFVNNTLGQAVTLTDHHNIQRTVTILNPNLDIVENGRTCMYEFSVEMEGVRNG